MTESQTESAPPPLPTSPEALLERLAALGIETRTVAHPPLFTVEQSKALRGQLPGGHTKNLFLRDKKGKMWLVTCLEDRKIDLKALEAKLGAGRLSFGSAERLMTYLGIVPGAVTPFALVNDTGKQVQFALDRGLLAHDPLNFHPLDNARTTSISPAGLMTFLEAVGHPPLLLDLESA